MIEATGCFTLQARPVFFSRAAEKSVLSQISGGEVALTIPLADTPAFHLFLFLVLTFPAWPTRKVDGGRDRTYN